MKLKIYIYALIAGQLLLFACKKNKDNLTYSPKVSAGQAKATVPGDIQYTLPAGSYLVGYSADVIVPFTIDAPGEIEQIDYKIWGASYTVTDTDSNILDESLSVPYDWVGIKTLQKGVSGNKDLVLHVNLKSVNAKSVITIQVIDKNKFKSSVTVTVNPVILGDLYTNNDYYTQRATAADAGTEVNRHLFLASFDNLGLDSASALKSNLPDIGFAVDTLGVLFISSPDMIHANSGNVHKALSLVKTLTSVFIAAPTLDPSTSTIQEILATDFSLASSRANLTVGGIYAYKNSNGAIGVIRVNSISNGGSSGNANATLNIDYRYNGPPIN